MADASNPYLLWNGASSLGRKVQGGISGYLRQEFRELEFLDEITRLKYKNSLPSSIVGVTRGYLIYLYRKWKTPLYIPKEMPNPLHWTNINKYENTDPVQESTWAEELKLKEKGGKKNESSPGMRKKPIVTDLST